MFRHPTGSKTLKIVLRATVAAASLGGTGSAYAAGGDGTAVNGFFTDPPGAVAQVPARQDPSAIARQADQLPDTYATSAHGGTWRFTPNQSGDLKD